MDLCSLNILSGYLAEIRSFLFNNGTSYVFPSLTMAMEDILVNVAKDPNFLKKFDDEDCKRLAKQITEVLEENKKNYTLSCSFENQLGKKVMVYKKIPVPLFNEPLGLKQLRKPHAAKSQPAPESTKTNTVMSSFKATCLNATLKFVKNDSQLVLQYPDVSTEQAEFIKHMIAQCLSLKDCSTTPGGRSIFDPLSEALKIYSTKYDFKLNNAVPVKTDMKRLFFEKIPKKNTQKNLLSEQNNKENVKDTPKTNEKDLDTKSISSVSSEESNDQNFAQNIKNLDRNFIKTTILDIEDFLLQDEYKMEFKNLTIQEEQFLMQWKSVLISSDIIKLFDEDIQDVLRNIKSIVLKYAGVCKIGTTMVRVSPSLRNVILTKKWYDEKVSSQTEKPMPISTPLVKSKTENDMNMTRNSSKNASVNSLTDKENKVSWIEDTEGTSENTTTNSSKENASGNSLKVNEEICKLKKDDFIVDRSLPIGGKMKVRELQTSMSAVHGSFVENTILQLKYFLMSTNETLHFTQLTRDEQNVVLRWESLMTSQQICYMFCTRGKLLLDEVRQILEVVRGFFHIAATPKNVFPNNRTVTLTKKIKKNPTIDIKTASDIVSPDLFDQLVALSKSIINIKPQHKLSNKINILSEDWIISSLNQLKSFIQDDSQASLIVQNLSQPQIKFLIKWQKILRKKKMITKYSNNIQVIMLDLQNCMTQKMAIFRISANTSKLRKDLTRDVTLTKTPYFGNSTKSQMPEKTESKNNTNKVEIADKTEIPKIDEPKRVPTNLGIPKSSSVTSLPVKKVPVLTDRGRPKSATLRPSQQAKAKLIEALSQPLVSERGLKMMRSMGWDGGALGLRGEGIVEPIALPLDLKKGAGLGCEKKPIIQPTLPAITNLPVNINRVILPHMPSKSELKTGLLQTMLNMVETTLPTELNFPQKLPQNYWAFVTRTVIGINKRFKYKNDPAAVSQLSNRIVDALSKTNYIVTACWGVSNMNVLFVLLKDIHQPLELDIKDWCSVVNVECKSDLVNTDKIAVVGEVFRYYVMSHIFEFCGQPNISIDKVPTKTLSKDISLKSAILPKQISFLRDLIKRLNNKSRPSTDTEKEKLLFDEIKDLMDGYTLDVDFPLAKCTDENKSPVYDVIRFYKIFDTPVPSKPHTHTQTPKIDTKDEKAVTKRRTTFTTDTFDEKCMFDSQNSPTSDHNADELKAARKNNLKGDGDCICCLDDYEMNVDEVKDVEYIFLDKETYEDIPIDNKDMKSNILNEDKDTTAETVENVDLEKDIKSMTIENLDDGKEKFMAMKTGDGGNDKTLMTINNLEHKKSSTAEDLNEEKENLEEQSDITPTVDNFDEKKDKTLIPIENLEQENNKKTFAIENLEISMTIENLDENIQNLSINDKIEEKNDLVGFSEDIKLFMEKNAQIQITNDKESNYICKRPISNASTPDRAHKKGRFEKFSKNINITPKNYPESKITNEIAGKIQKSILNSIDYTDDLPLLECHGIQDGGLLYTCHTEKSLNFITKLMKSLDFLVKITERENECHKMTVKIRSFVKESVGTIFDRLEAYNMSLDTKNWKVFAIDRSRDSVVISMKVDEKSFKYIHRQNFTLYTGIDQAKFNIIWD